MLAALAATPVFAADGDLLVKDPPLRRPHLLPGEGFLEDGAAVVLPTIRAWDMGLQGGVRVEATTESVGDGVSARYSFPAGGGGRIVHERTQVDEQALDRFDGVSFWVKGDGSDARGLITFGDRSVVASASFPLTSTRWRKIHLPWDRFDTPVRSAVRDVGFSIAAPRPGPVHFLVDRLRLYSTRRTESIAPTLANDAPGGQPAADFLAGREHIATTLGRLRERQPATLLFAGDSITAGVQLYYTVSPSPNELDWERCWSEEHLFGLQAGKAVAQRCGYSEAGYRFRRWDRGTEKWLRIVETAASARLQTIVYGAGGKQSSFALEHIDEYLVHKPSLVFYQFGGNDLIKKKDLEREFGRNLAELVRRSKAAGAEVALMTSPPMLSFSEPSKEAPYFHSGAAWADFIRRFAADHDCALVDIRAAFLARGLHHAGDLYSDWAHPNHRGHRLIARLVEELLAPSGQAIWDDVTS